MGSLDRDRLEELDIPHGLGRPIVVPDEPAPSLGELLERTAGGDREAFEDLMDRTGVALLSQARRFLDDQRSLDVVRETLVDVWRRAPRWVGAAEDWVASVFERRVRAELTRV
jgi:RNA polymerase sigma-70 factor, ECF subfamily